MLDNTDPTSWTFLSTLIGDMTTMHTNPGKRPVYGYQDLGSDDFNSEVKNWIYQIGGTASPYGTPAFRVNGLKQR
jgi:hypothetical protein